MCAERAGTRLSGHLWTLGRRTADSLLAPKPPPSRGWTARLRDPLRGELEISGRLSGHDGDSVLVLVLHGLGGCAESGYAVRAAAAAERAGFSCLRLNLRGSDRRGGDFYHGGLTADLHAALASPELERFRSVVLLGYSLGGHVGLRFATEPGDPRLAAAVAVCSPLDLEVSCRWLDGPGGALYRPYLLRSLKRIYRELASQAPQPSPVERVLAVRTLAEWDELTVVPRFGFADAVDYHRRASVGPLLERLRVPALLISARHDPVVTAAAVEPWLEPPPPALRTLRIARGGHVAFPRRLDLGVDAPRGLEGQALGWLCRAGASGGAATIGAYSSSR